MNSRSFGALFDTIEGVEVFSMTEMDPESFSPVLRFLFMENGKPVYFKNRYHYSLTDESKRISDREKTEENIRRQLEDEIIEARAKGRKI